LAGLEVGLLRRFRDLLRRRERVSREQGAQVGVFPSDAASEVDDAIVPNHAVAGAFGCLVAGELHDLPPLLPRASLSQQAQCACPAAAASCGPSRLSVSTCASSSGMLLQSAVSPGAHPP